MSLYKECLCLLKSRKLFFLFEKSLRFEFMTTVRKMEGAEKAALQDELKYYSGLLAAHYSSMKIHSKHPNVQSAMTRNPANSTYSTFKKTTNHSYQYKSTSLQPKNVTRLPNQNSKVMSNSSLLNKTDLCKKINMSNSFNLRKHPCKSSMVKVNPSVISYNSLNNPEKTLDRNLLKKDLLNSKKQIKSIVLNKTSGSSSRVLMDEIGLLIKQLKQKAENIDLKVNHASSNVYSLNKCTLDKPELKTIINVPTDSRTFCNTLNNNSQIIVLEDKNCNYFSTSDSSQPLSSENFNSYRPNGKTNLQEKPPGDMNDSLVKPMVELVNSSLKQPKHKIPKKELNETCQDICAKFENVDVLQVNNIIKTPVKKKLIQKRLGSVKKLSGTTVYASKYKVVNKKLPCVQQGKGVLVTSEVKTPLEMKHVKKHINNAKKTKGGARLITTQYKIINKKLSCVQPLNSKTSFPEKNEDTVCKLPINDKRTTLKTNGIKLKAIKLNSKYKIVNKRENPVIVPTSLFGKKIINVKESNFVHQGDKTLNKFNTSNCSRKNMISLKQNHLHALNLKRKKQNSSLNFFILKSKYRTVNKQTNSPLKKKSETSKSNNLNSQSNSSIDLDLLMELAAEKKKGSNNLVTSTPNKHILIKRVYKSKNAIVNKNICSLQSKAAKMIKTKYSILNKKHSWQKQSFIKRLSSPKSFKGHKFNSVYQRKMSFFHNIKNKRNNTRYKNQHHGSSYFTGRSYSTNYLVSKKRSNAVGPLQSMVKTPKKFILNSKVYLKTPNSMKSILPSSKTMASRALNRSINRVLTASVKKKTSKVNIYCMFYNRFGRCNKGIKCPYVHDPSKIAVCTRFLRGTCKTENCPFSHEICPGKMAICSFFLVGSCTKTDCPYRHETLSPNAKLCKAFVQGYCPDGKQCKQAHVLVCPQFVQGHCNKEDACPFPHPPSKEKKIIPNLAEKSENLEETEELILEKMSRYFECAYELVTNDKSEVSGTAVPRIRNLPEQPSFIAL